MERLPPLNALRVFEAVGRLQSVTAAAAELCVTPAAVSRHIRTLEEFLALPLFTRGHRSITLTAEGERYLAEIAVLFNGLRRATDNLTRRKKKTQVLKIRSPATLAVRWLIPRLPSFHARHPAIEVKLTTSFAPLDFQKEDIDGGIQLGNGNWRGKRADKLMDNCMTPVCSPALIRGKKLPLRLTSLKGAVLLHSLARPGDWAAWLKAAGAKDVDPEEGMKYETSMLAYQAAMEGSGFAMAQLALVQNDLRDGRLIAPFAQSLEMGAYTYYFVSPRTGRENPALEKFRAWLTEIGT
jgi:LysR family glycine cleavage system transcriptional activator